MIDPVSLVAAAEFDFGDTVFLRIADTRLPAMVTGYAVRPNSLKYWVTWPNAVESCHYALELTKVFVPVLDLKDGEKA